MPTPISARGFPPASLPPHDLMAKPTGAACDLACDAGSLLRKEAPDPGSQVRLQDTTL